MIVHIEGSNGETFMVRGRLVLKELGDLEDPYQWIRAIKMRDFKLNAVRDRRESGVWYC